MSIYSLAIKTYRLVIRLFQSPMLMMRRNRIALSAQIGKRTFLCLSTIGRYTFIANDVYVNRTTIGNYCSIASGTKIGGSEHAWWWGSTSFRIRPGRPDRFTTLGHDVWVGSNVVIRQGVKIGSGAVIGAGSVVLGDVGAFEVVAGVPAKIIRRRFNDQTIFEIMQSDYWNCSPVVALQLLNEVKFDEPSADTR